MNNLNLSDDKLNMLLAMAGKKLGQDPEELRKKLQNGSLDQVTNSLDPKAASQINALLQNPKALEVVLGSDQVKNMLGGIMGQKK